MTLFVIYVETKTDRSLLEPSMKPTKLSRVKTNETIVIDISITDHSVSVQFIRGAPDGCHPDLFELVVTREHVLVHLLCYMEGPGKPHGTTCE